MNLKVVSLNIWHGGRLFNEALEFLKKQDADIIALQEVHDSDDPKLGDRFRTMQVLREKLGYPYDDFAHAFLYTQPEGDIPHGIAIFSKFPISDRFVDFFVEPKQPAYDDAPENWPVQPRLLQGVKLTTPDGGEINFVNLWGVWDLAGENDSPARHKMVDAILKATDGKVNVVVTGDTNAKAINPAMLRLESSLKSVFGNELKSTFNMRRKDNPGYATAAVDHMYVSPNIEIVSKDCPDVDVSDHLPIVVKLKID